MEGEQTGVTTYPTGYTLGQLWADSGTAGAVTTNVTIGAAGKQATATSDDAGVWDVTGTLDDWSAYTVAFHPNIPIPAPLAFAAAAMMATPLAQPRRRTGIASRTITHNHQTVLAPEAPVEGQGVQRLEIYIRSTPRSSTQARTITQNLLLSTLGASDATLEAGENTITFTAPTATASPGNVDVSAGVNTVTFTAPDATLIEGGVPFVKTSWPNPSPRLRWPTPAIGHSHLLYVPGDATLEAGTNTITFTAPSAAVTTEVSVAAGVNTITFTAPTATAFAETSLAAGANTVTFSAPTATAFAEVSLAAGANTVTFSAPDATLIDEGAPFPFSLKDWPNPKQRPRGPHITIQTRPAVDAVVERPFVQSDWPLPRRAKTRRRDHIFYFVYDTYDPFTKYQGGQWKNPARMHGRSTPFYASNLLQTTLAGSGGNQTLDAGTNTVTFTAPSAAVLAEATLSAGANTITITAPTATAFAETSLAAGANTVTFSAPDATVASGDVSLAAGVNTVTFTAPTATLFADATLAAGANTITLTAPTATAVPGDTSIAAGTPTIVFTAPFALLVDSNATPPARATRYGYRYRYESREY